MTNVTDYSINYFIENHLVEKKGKVTGLADSTKKVYKCYLAKVENLFGKKVHELDDELIVETIKAADLTHNNKRDILKTILSYYKFQKLDFPLTKNYHDELQISFIPKSQRENQEPIITRTDVKEKLEEIVIENPQHRLLINLLTKYNQVFRNDLANVKFRGTDIEDAKYSDGVITIKKFNKLDDKIQPISLTLNLEDKSLLDEILKTIKGDYILFFNCQDTKIHRNNNYTKLVKKITEKYLGKPITQNTVRHQIETEMFKDTVNNDELTWIKKYRIMYDSALQRGHNLNTVLNSYIDNIDKIEKVKTGELTIDISSIKTLNIMKDGKLYTVLNF